jgi:ABC-type glutathione transport system ATPase component
VFHLTGGSNATSMLSELQSVPQRLSSIVSVRNLTLQYVQRFAFGARTPVTALSNVSLELVRGRTLALVGPSGCGKSSLARCLVVLERPSFGQIWYDGRDILQLGSKELKHIRRDIHLIFQDSASALNPGMTIEEVLLEPLEIHEPSLGKKDRFLRLVASCDQAALSSKWLTRRPGELSGGQRQRVAIARALVSRPKILILDEALTALDLSTQSQIANLLLDLQMARSLTYLCITHDARLARLLAHDVVSMEAGSISNSTSQVDLLTSNIQAKSDPVSAVSRGEDTGRASLQTITFSKE